MAEWLGTLMTGWPAWTVIATLAVIAIFAFLLFMFYYDMSSSGGGLTTLIEQWRKHHDKS